MQELANKKSPKKLENISDRNNNDLGSSSTNTSTINNNNNSTGGGFNPELVRQYQAAKEKSKQLLKAKEMAKKV
eukprot:Pgem_evm1s5545